MKMLRVTGATIAALAIVPIAAAPAAAAEPFGYTGIVRDEGGNAIEGACLLLQRTESTVEAEFCTGADGRYTITGVPTDVSYKVRIQATGYRTEWWYDAPTFLNAEAVWVPASALVERDIVLGVGAGTVRGRITDEHGAPADATVTLRRTDRESGYIVYTWDLGDGRYELGNLPPGEYTAEISDNRHGRQWVPQKDSQSDAAIITISDGGVTVIDEQWLPLGTVEVAVLDTDSGRPVPRPCVYIRTPVGDSQGCGANGLVRVEGVQAGDWDYTVSGGASYFAVDDGRRLQVGHGETVRLAAELAPAAAITTSVVDAGTGQPVAGICVRLVVPNAGGQPSRPASRCSNDNGVLEIGPLTESGDFQLYAKQNRNRPPAVLYGDQWVTADGGTGDQRKALTVTIKPKQTVTVPPIKVDPPGAISGIIRDAATGAPVSGVCAYPYAFNASGGHVRGKHCSTAQGQYTIEDLGPYEWPVEFTPNGDSGYTWQWSGDAADRFGATYIKVASGQIAAMDTRLVKGGVLAGKVTRSGAPVSFGSVWSYNARTGDSASPAYANVGPDGTFALGGHRGQEVYVRYWSENECWYGRVQPGSRRPAAAVPVSVTAGGTTTVALDMVSTCAKQPYTPITPPVKPPPPR